MALIVLAIVIALGGVTLGTFCLLADSADKRFASGLGAAAALVVAGFSGLAAQAVSVVWSEQRRRETISETWSKRAHAYDTVLAELLKVFTQKPQEIEQIRAIASLWAGTSVLHALVDWNRFAKSNNNQQLSVEKRRAAKEHILAVAVAMRLELFPEEELSPEFVRDAILPTLFDDKDE